MDIGENMLAACPPHVFVSKLDKMSRIRVSSCLNVASLLIHRRRSTTTSLSSWKAKANDAEAGLTVSKHDEVISPRLLVLN